MNKLLQQIKKIIPNRLFKALQPIYHFTLSVVAVIWYGFPSRKLRVIGVTGTSGKSTSIEFISRMLEEAGYVVGSATTIRFKVGKKEWLNDRKMTMVGRFMLQRLLRDMVVAGCHYAIIETTSEGIKQFRHIGIDYDTVVFTNLYPEHIDSHGSFENYKSTKLKLFEKLENSRQKKLNGKKIPRTIVVNSDDEHANEFINFKVEEKIAYSCKSSDVSYELDKKVEAKNIRTSPGGLRFDTVIDSHLRLTNCSLRIFGEHNVYNALAAISVGVSEGVGLDVIRNSLQKIKCIPGRIEFVDEGQDFKVIVDYAFEPRAMQKLYDVVGQIPHKRVIHVLGTTGGGRDADRGEKLGEMAGVFADQVIVTNEDPYDDDPRKLMRRVVGGVEKTKCKDTFLEIEDRRQAIRVALGSAQKGDIVLITGKGSEQGIVGADNNIIPWDDREVVREELGKLRT